MMIGLPGSGKSSYAKHLIGLDKSKETLIISRDSLREMCVGSYELFGEYVDNTEQLIMAWTLQMVDAAIHAGKNIVLDECNISKWMRSYWVEPFKKLKDKNGNPVTIMGVYVDADPDVCKERRKHDTKNSNTNWDAVIDRMVSQFEKPTEDEFDQLTIINERLSNDV